MYFDIDMDLHIIALGLILMVVTSLYSFSPLPRYFFSSLYISHVLLIIFSISFHRWVTYTTSNIPAEPEHRFDAFGKIKEYVLFNETV